MNENARAKLQAAWEALAEELQPANDLLNAIAQQLGAFDSDPSSTAKPAARHRHSKAAAGDSKPRSAAKAGEGVSDYANGAQAEACE